MDRHVGVRCDFCDDLLDLLRQVVDRAQGLPAIDQDVLSALLNLGCGRPQAEAAVRKAKAAGGPAGFEPLFRRALELVR